MTPPGCIGGVSWLLSGVVTGLRFGHMENTLTLSLGQQTLLLTLRRTHRGVVVVVGQTVGGMRRDG